MPLAECALARAVSVVGDAWSLLILRETIHGVTRFEYMHHDLSTPRTVLSKRLKELVESQLLKKMPGEKDPTTKLQHLRSF